MILHVGSGTRNGCPTAYRKACPLQNPSLAMRFFAIKPTAEKTQKASQQSKKEGFAKEQATEVEGHHPKPQKSKKQI